MKKTRFMKIYQYFLLPIYLMSSLGLFMGYVSDYGLFNIELPIICTITIALTELTYIFCISLIIYLLMTFRQKNQRVYRINMIVLFLFPFILQIDAIIEQAILCNMGKPISPAIFIHYIIGLVIYFLPQIIYFKKRKDLFSKI